MKNWSGKKKVFALFGMLLVIVGLIATIFLVKTKLNTRTQAEKATTLSFSPLTQTVEVNKEATLDININPGVNQVSFVKLVIKFDPTKFDSPSTTFTIDPTSALKINGEPVVTQGQIAVVMDTGSDPTKVISTPQKIGTLKLTAGVQNDTQEPDLIAGDTQITFDQEQTQVRSIGSEDSSSENVLQSAPPATVTIEAICKDNVSTCSWDALIGASSYDYVIKNITENKVVSEGNTVSTSVDFTSFPGMTYKCEVKAKNFCGGLGDMTEASNICATPSGTPSLTPPVSPTPGPSTTPTLTPTVTVSPTPGPSSTPTPTTPGSSITPTPTTPLTSSIPTPTTEVLGSPTPTEALIAEGPTPTLPPTGNPFVIGGIVGGVLILLGGLALLFL